MQVHGIKFHKTIIKFTDEDQKIVKLVKFMDLEKSALLLLCTLAAITSYFNTKFTRICCYSSHLLDL